MRTGAAAVGRSTEVPPKHKPERPRDPATPLPGQCRSDAHKPTGILSPEGALPLRPRLPAPSLQVPTTMWEGGGDEASSCSPYRTYCGWTVPRKHDSRHVPYKWALFTRHPHVNSSVQSLSRVRLFATPWTAARQASLSSPTPGACSNSCPWSQ